MKKSIPLLLIFIAIGIVVAWRLAAPQPATSTSPNNERVAETSQASSASLEDKQSALSNNHSPNHSIAVQASNDVDIEINKLIGRIGNRRQPKEQPQNVAALARMHNDDMTSSLGEVFPSAQELVAKGESATVPLARYWATLRDPTSDAFIAATRALRALQSRQKTHELFLHLASQESNAEKKTIYMNAAKRFAPITTAPTP